MKKFKKTLVSLVMVLLLAFTIVPSTNVTVQAASVGKVTGLKAVYTKGQTGKSLWWIFRWIQTQCDRYHKLEMYCKSPCTVRYAQR